MFKYLYTTENFNFFQKYFTTFSIFLVLFFARYTKASILFIAVREFNLWKYLILKYEYFPLECPRKEHQISDHFVPMYLFWTLILLLVSLLFPVVHF